MKFPEDILVRIMIFALGLCGFLVARYIYKSKKEKIPLICPIGFDCNFVVHSNYSKFLNVPLEIFGMIYYAFLTIFYLYFIFVPDPISVFLFLFLFLASLGSAIFSVYLLIVQIFILKKGCSWCFVSAFIAISIFILTVFNYDFRSLTQIFI